MTRNRTTLSFRQTDAKIFKFEFKLFQDNLTNGRSKCVGKLAFDVLENSRVDEDSIHCSLQGIPLEAFRLALIEANCSPVDEPRRIALFHIGNLELVINHPASEMQIYMLRDVRASAKRNLGTDAVADRILLELNSKPAHVWGPSIAALARSA